MKSCEHTALSIGALDESVFTNSTAEKERLRTRCALHSVLARRPELSPVLSRVTRYPGAREFLEAIR